MFVAAGVCVIYAIGTSAGDCQVWMVFDVFGRFPFGEFMYNNKDNKGCSREGRLIRDPLWRMGKY